MVNGYWQTDTVNCEHVWVKQRFAQLVSDRISISIFGDSLSDEALYRGASIEATVWIFLSGWYNAILFFSCSFRKLFLLFSRHWQKSYSPRYANDHMDLEDNNKMAKQANGHAQPNGFSTAPLSHGLIM